MRAYVGGDPAAFGELFERYAPLLEAVFRRRLRRAEEARDLVQQTFLHLHRSRADFREDARLRPWLFTIGMNLLRESQRRSFRRPEATLELDGVRDPAVEAAGQQRVDAARTLEVALGALPADQRDVITLHWLAGVPLPEVAEIVGASLSAVKVRAHRGYAAMRRALGEKGDP